MKNKFNNFNKVEILLILSLIVLFFFINSNILSYGLPFFQQADENAF